MKINKIFDGIYEVENFINEKKSENIYSFLKNKDDSEWSGEFSEVLTLDTQSSYILNVINIKLLNFLEEELKSTGFNFHRIKKDRFLPKHKDIEGNKNVCLGLVIYFNENYEGGEIFYNDLEIKIKPKKYSMLMHQSNINHEVLKVEDGTRYFATNFIKFNNGKMPTLLEKI